MSNMLTEQIALKIGLLIRESKINAWEALMIRKIKAIPEANIQVVLRFNQHQHDTFRYKAKSKIYDKILAFDKRKFRIDNAAIDMEPVDPLLEGIKTIHLKPLVKKRRIVLTDDVLDEIKTEELDLILSIGKGPLIKPLSTLTKFGLWTHFPEHKEGKVIPTAGFWELINGRGVAKGALFAISPKDLQQYELYKSFSSTEGISIHKIYNRVYWKMASFVPRVLKQLHLQGKDMMASKFIAENKIQDDRIWKNSLKSHYIPLVKYTYQFLVTRFLKKKIKQKWVMLFHMGKEPSVDFNEYNMIYPTPGEFWADPFMIHQNGKYYVYFEACPNVRRAKGNISLLEIDEKGNYSAPRLILKKDHHFSYPFLFQWKNEWYMIPETSETNQIELYKCTKFPYQWEFQHPLMKNVQAVDSTLFFHNDKWWLFVNISENPGASSWDELFLFYSDNPISKNWVPHPKNPVISDVSVARPAGNIFMDGGRIIRPSQNSAFIYGYGLKFNEILVLNENEYQEKTVESFEPTWDKSIKTIHTYNRVGELTLIDAVFKNKKVY
jgi:hypothetical protein